MTEHADNHSTHYLWIVAANTDEYGRVYLADYVGLFEHDVQRKVMAGAERERIRCTLSERLEQLNWEIVRVRVQESEKNECDRLHESQSGARTTHTWGCAMPGLPSRVGCSRTGWRRLA